MSQIRSYLSLHDEDVDAAFAAGLFHDVGRLVIINALPEVVPRLIAEWEAKECTFEEVEAEFLEVTHSELSQMILEKWKLPEVIQNAALYHHHPEKSAAASSLAPGEGLADSQTLSHNGPAQYFLDR